jgi:hypothetical protein
MADNQEKDEVQNALLRYAKRRDRILIVVVLIYMFGPNLYHWLESMNDIHLNFERIDFSSHYSGEMRMLHEIKGEIFDLRMEISKERGRTFGWRDVFEDLAR